MTPEIDKAQARAILKLAYQRLKNYEGSYFICWAITDAVGELGYRYFLYRKYAYTGQQLRELIRQRLKGETTLENWLLHRRRIAYLMHRNYPERLKATRLAWVESLIKEFS